MQRQLRLGDILDDYCPRERRVTNHVIVAMVGTDVKRTRCTTCEAEHEYKQAKVPRQRRKAETPAALYSAVLAGGPKRVAAPGQEPEEPMDQAMEAEQLTSADEDASRGTPAASQTESRVVETGRPESAAAAAPSTEADADADVDETDEREEEEGPVHRPLIRASLPRQEGQAPPQRPAPDFTIRQPGGGRPGRFRPRHQRGPQTFQSQGNRSNGNAGGPSRGGMPRHNSSRPPHGAMPSRIARRNGPGRKRSK